MPSPSKKISLNGAQDILDFFRENQKPLFYVSTSTYNVLGADRWIGNLRFINSLDSFDGGHPLVFTAVPLPGQITTGIEAANNYLLAHPSVADHVRRSGPGAGVLFLLFDERTEALAHALGLSVAHPPAKLRQHLDNKITTTRLATRAGISSVPNVLAPVDSYGTLREVARELGPDLVVQLPYGDSGATTFFISCETDYRLYADQIAVEPEVKVMKRICCRQTTIEGCATRHGTLAGPLITEMVGFPELTPFPGGWCGNEIFAADASTLISPDVRRQAQRAVIAMGDQLRREGYWGCFGIDFLLDQDSGTLYFGEMNPRITGATPLTNHAARDQNQPPLLLFHLLEWLGIDFALDVDEFNQRWTEARTANWSQLIIEYIRDESETLANLADRLHAGQWIVISIFGMGAVTAGLGLGRHLYITIACSSLIGVLNAPSYLGRQLLIQRTTPGEIRGRVSSVFFVLRDTGFMIGMAAAGLADLFDVRLLILITAFGLIVCGTLALTLPGLGQRTAEWRRTLAMLQSRPENQATLGLGRAADLSDIDRLCVHLPVMAHWTSSRRQALAAHTRVFDVEPGTAIVRQGELTNMAYFVLHGRTVATRAADGDRLSDPGRILDFYNPGDFFGEIAALTNLPRTAIVLADDHRPYCKCLPRFSGQ
jgi:hypothetical protein